MNNRSEGIRNILVPMLSVTMGFLLGAIIMIIFGYDPVTGYQTILETASRGKKSIGEILVTAAPLIFTTLGFSVANSAGFLNIGLPKQALCGRVASIWIALSTPDAPRMIALPVAVIVGAVAGTLAAAIPGFLRAHFGTSEVIVMITLNYILLYTGNYAANNVMKPSVIVNKGVTKMIGVNVSLHSPFLASISDDSCLSTGIFLAFIFPIPVWFLMKKTTLGFEIRLVGLDLFAFEYTGMSNKRTIILSMMISGTPVGLGGAVQRLGAFQNLLTQNTSSGIGFDGMAMFPLGASSSTGILPSALLFGMLRFGRQGIPLIVGVPTELVDVVIAAVTFFVGISYLIHFLLAKTSGSKKEVAIIRTIEAAPDKNDRERRDI